jgi:hypothetical protein
MNRSVTRTEASKAKAYTHPWENHQHLEQRMEAVEKVKKQLLSPDGLKFNFSPDQDLRERAQEMRRVAMAYPQMRRSEWRITKALLKLENAYERYIRPKEERLGKMVKSFEARIQRAEAKKQASQRAAEKQNAKAQSVSDLAARNSALEARLAALEAELGVKRG